ncbi:sialic acid-binding Ig-like lectin 5 [Trichechus inunguis]
MLLTPKMLLLLLLLLLWAGSLAQYQRFQLQMKESVTVQEGLCVLVPCFVHYPQMGWTKTDPAQGYWFWNEADYVWDAPVATNNPARKVQEETKGRFHLIGDPQNNNCSLDIRDARMADTGSYFFRIVRGTYVLYNFKSNLLSLYVTALTRTPDIHIQGTLKSGHPTTISCKVPWACNRGTPPTFSWIGVAVTSPGAWIGVAVTSLGSKTPYSSELTLTPEPHHHGTNLTCRVTFPGADVTTESTVLLNVSYPPQLFGPSCSWETKGLHCTCSARAWPAPYLCWRDGDKLVEGNSSTSFMVNFSSTGPWTNSSLSLSTELISGLRLSCDAHNALGNQSVTVLLLPGKPRTWSQIAQGITWAASITALLTLCLCLIFFTVKVYKKKSAEAAASRDDINPVLGTSSKGHLNESWSGSPSDYLSSAVAAPTSREEQELHYASVSFQGVRPWNSQRQEATNTTEYSEIKIHK